MPTLLLTNLISEESKEFSNILDVVDANRKTPVMMLHSQAILEQYKQVSEVINSVDTAPKNVRVKSLKAMMNESVFHGSCRFGNNFIA